MPRTPDQPLPDAPARLAVSRDVDVNMVVEAAAGTGKTTSLVARLMTLFKQGALAGDGRLAAVTFTHKAASELRERLDRELAQVLQRPDDLSEGELAGLRAAATALPECHIGTIHSFCARLLRERPVEAGLGLEFRELDASADLMLRREAWREFAAAMRRGERAELDRVFRTFGLDLEALANGFTVFADYPDVEEWVGDDMTPDRIDRDAFAAGLAAYRSKLAPHIAAIMDISDPGTDAAIPAIQRMEHRLTRFSRTPGLADLHRLAGLFKGKFVEKAWKERGFDKETAAGLKKGYADFVAETVAPFRRDCLAAVYAAALAAYRKSRDIYDRLRRERREVNFQDLLMAAARLLRDFPEVRADLAERFPRLLVDEVQDTDPVQAEIMFLLAADDPRERDWRRCRPRPGSLFIVGDPKQSIYRFRRADIAIYQEVKRRVAETGGRILGLTANFRAQPELLAWVNQTFRLPEDAAADPGADAKSGRFPDRESPYNPEYMDLVPGRPAVPGAGGGVFYLETSPGDSARDSEARTLDLAARIASFIRHAVDSGMPIPDAGGLREAVPGDFLIVTYTKSEAAPYADALRRLGLPCRVSSGRTLAESPGLGLLLAHLQALAAPDDPVLWTAVLRGGLWGIDDARLYRWKKAGGSFNLLAPLPETDDAELAAVFRRAFLHREWLRHGSPALAAARIAQDLGLWARAGAGPGAGTDVAALAVALETLAAEGTDIATPGKLAERLEWLMENHEDDPLPALPADTSAVRVMNLHKTKGLEAPVVFLTCKRTVREQPPRCVVRRGERVRGALSLRGGERAAVMAQPARWEELAEEEELYLAAEKTRLNYVAATRAGTLLVYAAHKSGGKPQKKGGTSPVSWTCRYLPGFRPGASIALPLPEPEPAAPVDRAAAGVDREALETRREERATRRETMLRESYRRTRAKSGDGWGLGPDAPSGSEAAMDAGEVAHRLLAMNAPEAELREAAEALLQEYGLPGDLAAELTALVAAARKSPIWRRAEKAEKAFREAPFTLPLPASEGGGLQRGVIDLAFREAGGWVVVDYKTERLAADADAGRAAAAHAPQLAAYAAAWRAITGEPVTETGILFLRTGEYVRVQA